MPSLRKGKNKCRRSGKILDAEQQRTLSASTSFLATLLINCREISHAEASKGPAPNNSAAYARRSIPDLSDLCHSTLPASRCDGTGLGASRVAGKALDGGTARTRRLHMRDIRLAKAIPALG